MKQKPINPYSRLFNEIKDFCRKLKYAHNVVMFRYPAKNIKTASWNLNDLYERTIAAEQLGYEVKISACDDYLTVKYVKKVPIPWMWS